MLLVVALPAADAASLTLREWDLLTQREQVLFEDPTHPLIARLTAHGISAGPFDDEPQPDDATRALVAEPGSERIVELARAGAVVLSDPGRGPDPLTVAHGAAVSRRAAGSLGTLAQVMARLRGPDGCPWDQEQSHESLRVHLIEEAYEVLDAIDRAEVGADLEEELGDLLLQVFFHAQLASEDGRFDVGTVAERLVAKLLHRHPHVFGETVVADAGEVVRNWESIKAAEKERSGPFDDVPAGLPALLYSYKMQKRAAALDFAADRHRALTEANRALDVLRSDASPAAMGAALFWLVALARAAGIDPEGALRSETNRFRDTF